MSSSNKTVFFIFINYDLLYAYLNCQSIPYVLTAPCKQNHHMLDIKQPHMYSIYDPNQKKV
ncbi:hypothetical protein HanRHA438_Chr00c13g0849951 [Helianthus annuus]|nr:hypothetical protein HanRHA438_Chr00c13g0849951 [Helianthus annuus]